MFNFFKCAIGATPPIEKPVLDLTSSALAIHTYFLLITFLICLVAGDKRCSLNKLKKVISKKDVCMANAEEVKVNTGFSIGGVAPIAHLKKLNILIDQSLGRFQSVFAAAGHPNSIFKIEYSQLVQMSKGEVKEIIE